MERERERDIITRTPLDRSCCSRSTWPRTGIILPTYVGVGARVCFDQPPVGRRMRRERNQSGKKVERPAHHRPSPSFVSLSPSPLLVTRLAQFQRSIDTHDTIESTDDDDLEVFVRLDQPVVFFFFLSFLSCPKLQTADNLRHPEIERIPISRTGTTHTLRMMIINQQTNRRRRRQARGRE